MKRLTISVCDGYNADRQHSGAYDHPRHILRRCPWPWALENPRPQEKTTAEDSAGQKPREKFRHIVTAGYRMIDRFQSEDPASRRLTSFDPVYQHR